MPSKLLPKGVWKNAVGAFKKPRRLHLNADDAGNFHCPVISCDSESFRSQRGCRKHVFMRHGWYYYFDEKPNSMDVLPAQNTKVISRINKTKQSNTSKIPMFLRTCQLAIQFKAWLTSPGGGGKGEIQAEQIVCKILKFAKYCCDDVSPAWEIPDNVIDYCLGSITLISDFITYLKDTWEVGYAGIIGYMNALSHLLDFRRAEGATKTGISVFIVAEIYIDRVKKTLSKKMKSEWTTLLSIDYLSKIDCWATLEELQQVIPFHADKFTQIILNSSDAAACIPSHDLSFCTSYIIAVLFLMVKASRPMTFQYLTVTMVQNIKENGIIDQTVFKTNEKYGFDSLIFSENVLHILNGYIKCIRPRLHPVCDYLLISRNGTQLLRLSDVFGRIIYQAIGKYINPTRYRQIIETESSEKLSIDDQHALSEDQKHTSLVAKIHYQKTNSRLIAEKGKACMDKLRDENKSLQVIEHMKETICKATEEEADFSIVNKLDQCSIQKDKTEVIEPCDSLRSNKNVNQRQKKVPFSGIEDSFLQKGIKRYGKGKWKSILSDPEFKFHPSRKTATLLVRAKSQNFI